MGREAESSECRFEKHLHNCKWKGFFFSFVETSSQGRSFRWHPYYKGEYRGNIIYIGLLEGLAVEKSLPYLTDEDKQDFAMISWFQMETLDLTDETNGEYIRLNAAFHQIL